MNIDIRWSRQTTSTNELALAGDATAPWTIWVTDHQTAGRGRLSDGARRSWLDVPARCLLMSVYVTPDVPLHAAPRITLAAGVAIAEFLTETAGIEATLKWPNDIMVHGRKLGGILVESTTCQGSLCAAIGIGLNVNVAQEEIPTEVRASATSLQTEAGRRFDRLGLLTGIVEALREAIATLETNRGELGELRARWEARSGVAGKAVVVNGRPATVRCLARGGGLEVEWSDGSTGTVESGLIQW